MTQKITMEAGAQKLTKWIGSTKSVVLHTLFFVITFSLPLFGVSFDRMMLLLTTVVSLEAIYLSIFIQMSINMNNQSIETIQEGIDVISEDIEEISEGIEEIGEGIDEMIEDDEDDIVATPQSQSELLSSIQLVLDDLQKQVNLLKPKNKQPNKNNNSNIKK